MAKRFAKTCIFALFALLAAGPAGWALFEGQVACFSSTLDLAGIKDIYRMPLAIALLGMALVVSVAYMFGSYAEKPEILTWAKSEGVTLVWSVVLILCVFGAFMFMCNITQWMMCLNWSGTGGGSCPYAGSNADSPAVISGRYLDSLTSNYGLPLATSLVQSSINDQFAAMPFAYWGFPWDPAGGGGVAYLSNRKAWSAQKEVVASLYVPLMMSIKAQQMALSIVFNGVVEFLLPAALVLRVFFFSRDIGNFLLALSFAIYFFLPLTYVLAEQASANVIGITGDASNPFKNLPTASDFAVGDAYQRLGFLTVQAVLIPNMALVILMTATMALNKAFKGFAA